MAVRQSHRQESHDSHRPSRRNRRPALAATAVFTGSAAGSASAADGSTAAVFVQTDNPSGNAIVAYDQAPDGSLHRAGTYPTGGLGGVLAGSVVDHLASQGSLAYDHADGLLYAVNAGSNTVTVFAVHGDRLSWQQVISSGGTFPVSVAFHGNLVYVLNARGGGSVQGYYRLASGRLVLIPAWHRSLGLDPALTPEFTHTPGQIGFTPDGSKIVVTTKANGNSIDVFTLGPGGLPAGPVVTTEPNTVQLPVRPDRRERHRGRVPHQPRRLTVRDRLGHRARLGRRGGNCRVLSPGHLLCRPVLVGRAGPARAHPGG